MNLILKNNTYKYEMENLLRIFFANEKITVCDDESENHCICDLKQGDTSSTIIVSLKLDENEFSEIGEFNHCDALEDDTIESFLERKMAILLFQLCSKAIDYTPPWGILTGVRPSKLMLNLCEKMGERAALDYFLNELKVSVKKTKLALMVARNEKPIADKSQMNSFSLYISIPFCPSRCSYCSFISHSNDKAIKLMPKYVELLCEEIEETAKIALDLGLKLETVYMGGGTPTALNADQLKQITDAINANFNTALVDEYTIEAGRPDSVTDDKFKVISACGCNRISINPQTFSDEVLKEIGRNHTAQQTLDAMQMARDNEFYNINMDLIAGLPKDTLESFKQSVETTLSLFPENITVHTLALKRSSNIVMDNKETNSAKLVEQMLDFVEARLTKEGYVPYYMYRQSKCLGNFENVGWARKGFECLYNIFMMEEIHTILAVGAGAVTKLRSPIDTKIERIFNYKYPYEYINDFDEILNRKKQIITFYAEYLGGNAALD